MYLTQNVDYYNSNILDTMNEIGLTSKLIELLGSNNMPLASAILRAIGNMLETRDNTAKLIEHGLLPMVKRLLIRYQAEGDCRAIIYIARIIRKVIAGSREHIELLMEKGFITILYEMLVHSNNIASTEAVCALSNAASSGDKHIMKLLVEEGLIKHLSKYLENRYKGGNYRFDQSQDESINVVALQLMENILIIDNSTGLTEAQVKRLKEEYHIYLTNNGRISMAGLNSRNVDYFAEAVDKVVREA